MNSQMQRLFMLRQWTKRTSYSPTCTKLDQQECEAKKKTRYTDVTES